DSMTLAVQVADGTLTAVTIHIAVINAAAVIRAPLVSVVQTCPLPIISTAGTLTISDVDSPQSFLAQPATLGTYGTFAIDAAGARSEERRVGKDWRAGGSPYSDKYEAQRDDGSLTAAQSRVTVNNGAVL